MSDLTPERLRSVLEYNEGTGEFRWRKKIGRAVGKRAAGAMRPDGYLVIQVDGRPYRAHTLAWFYVHGSWPAQNLDHINRSRSDNRISNLRPASRSQNMANLVTRAGRRVTGVTYAPHAKRYMARIGIDGATHFLGYFATEGEASEAYQSAKRAHFGEFVADVK